AGVIVPLVGAWGSTDWGWGWYWVAIGVGGGGRENAVVWEWYVFVVWSDWCVQRLRLAAVRATHTRAR
ncbi:MAG: hypothetical protein WBQ59_16110, partial [Candidatus Acidiferrum sp.]